MKKAMKDCIKIQKMVKEKGRKKEERSKR